MDDALYRQWWPLHLQVVRGEILDAEQKARYEAGLRQMEQDENLSRATLAEALPVLESVEADRSRLVAREQQLNAEIAELQGVLAGTVVRLPSGVVCPVESTRAKRDEKPRTIYYTELTDPPSDSPLYTEWMTYRGELPKLLAEGHEGEFVLIKGTTISGLYCSHQEANAEGCRRFPFESFLIHHIQTQEPILRVSPYCHPCRS